MNYFELKKYYEKQFFDANILETADIDWIMVEITGERRSALPFHNFSELELQKIDFAIQERIKNIPIGYIFGKTEFFGKTFFVDNNTLIPRMDTEVLIENILPYIEICKLNRDNVSVLDIGTGSGIIGITIQIETLADVTAVDISEKALRVAVQNAENLGAKVEFINSNLFEKLSGKKFDFIVSNPPYIRTDVIDELDPEVKFYEPILALDGGEDGLDFYREIIYSAKKYLKPQGMLFFEIGYDQAKDVEDLMKIDFENIVVKKDYSNNDRVIFGKLRS